MITRLCERKLWWAAALLLLPLVSPVRSEEASDVPTDRLLPTNTYVYLTIPSWEEFGSRWSESLMGRLQTEPQFAEFGGQLKALWGKWSEKVSEKTGLTLDEILAIPSGEASLALAQLPGKDPSVVAILDFGDSEEAVNKLLAKAEEALEEQGAKRRESSKNDTTIVLYVMPAAKAEEGDEDAPAEKKKDDQFAYFVKDSRLVVGTDVAILEAILSRWDGNHKQTFADNEAYQYILERVQPDDETDAAMLWYVNPIELVRAGVQQAGQGNMQAQMALGFLPALGLDKFKAMGGSYDLATEEFDAVSRTLLYVDQPTAGLIDVFLFPAAEQTPPKWVPASATAWYGVNWDINAAYEAIETLVDTFRGEGTFEKLIDQMAKNEQGPQLHLKKDFIDLLTGRMDIYSEPPTKKADDDEVEADRFLMSFTLKNADKMKGVMSKLAKTEGFPGKSREFEGATIYELARPGAADPEATMGMAVADQRMIVASDVTLLEQILRNDADRKSLADDPEFQQIARKLPEKTSIAGFQRQDAQVKQAYDMLRSGQMPFDLEGIDFSKLPPFEVLEKYLPATGSYAEPDERGALMTSFTLKTKPGSKDK